MTSPDTDREKLLVKETEIEGLQRDLRRAEAENLKLLTELMQCAAIKDQPKGKGIIVHLLEIVKIMAIIIVALVGAKMGLGK